MWKRTIDVEFLGPGGGRTGQADAQSASQTGGSDGSARSKVPGNCAPGAKLVLFDPDVALPPLFPLESKPPVCVPFAL